MKKNNHLQSAEETYAVHFITALGYFCKLLYAAFAVLVHAVLPQLHQNTASRIAHEIYDNVSSRHSTKKNK